VLRQTATKTPAAVTTTLLTAATEQQDVAMTAAPTGTTAETPLALNAVRVAPAQVNPQPADEHQAVTAINKKKRPKGLFFLMRNEE